MSFKACYFKIVLSKKVIFGERYFVVLGVFCSTNSFYVKYSVSKFTGPIANKDSSLLTIDEFIISTFVYFSTTCIWLDLCKT